MFVHAIPQVAPERKGIHVLWAGPRPWLYSPAGWIIRRRVFERRDVKLDCVFLTATELDRLRVRHELPTRLGPLTLRRGPWVTPVAVQAKAAATGPVAEIITLELAAPQTSVRVDVQAEASFAVALRDGKVVAGGTVVSGLAFHHLSAPQIDVVITYTLGLKTFGICVQQEDAEAWEKAPVVKELQLPIGELMPSLRDAGDEFAEAKSRLLSDESLDPGEFESLTENLRMLVNADGPPRPIDLALLLREEADQDPQELCALDPIRAMLIHPRWRRILGFAWFDDDPELIPGAVYEYRVTGGFPATDLDHRVYGFHTIPSGTSLPAEFYLDGVRLRFPQPRTVELAQRDDGSSRQVTRRGVQLTKHDQPWWLLPSLDHWSVVIDFPAAVTSVSLDVEPGHDLSFATGAAWLDPSGSAPLPPGPRAQLVFPEPVHELLLEGRGFLESIRILTAAAPPDERELRPLSATTAPTPFVDAPLPDPPLFAAIRNLQEAQPVLTTDQVTAPTPHPHELGFEVSWRPAPRAGVIAWPPDLGAPPLDAALFQVEHRQVAPVTTEFTPVIDKEENLTLGDRAHGAEATPPIHFGVDLMTVFPEVRPPAAGAADLFWRDVFDFEEDGSESPGVRRPLPPPGTRHQYRVRAVDPVGRPSAVWVETGDERLEKHVPPPLPAAPELTSADNLPEPALTGVRARVLVRDASDLTDAERAILGTHANAIILTWGWHEEQRRQDHFAQEFRVYATRRVPGLVRGTLVSAVPVGGDRFDAAINGDRAFAENAGRGSILDAGARFRVLGHGAGPAATLQLRALERVAGAFVPPRLGAVELPIRITPDQTRARFWGPRVAVLPIDARTVYTHTFFDLLDLSPVHPRDLVQIGVSSADGEAYVPDPLAPDDTRPGNESPLVTVQCEGRWQGRPVVVDAPSLAPVPVIVTPEPGARPLTFRLDLTPHAPFPPNAFVRPERVADDEVFRAYRTENGRVIARVAGEPAPGDAEQDVTVPNAGDRAAIIAALSSGNVAALEDRFVVFLAAKHPHRARLFQPASRTAVRLNEFEETLPNRGARWTYRLRLADAAGRFSQDAATLPVIVRVPATTELAAPVRVERGASRMVLRVAATSEVTELLLFTRELASQNVPRDGAEFLRIASASGPAATRVRLRLPDGTLIAPSVKSLADPDIQRDGSFRLVTVNAPPNGLVRVWACAATRDGVLSLPGGPWRLGEVTP
jgi:hypothetical protein